MRGTIWIRHPDGTLEAQPLTFVSRQRITKTIGVFAATAFAAIAASAAFVGVLWTI